MLGRQVGKQVWFLILAVLALALVTLACGKAVSPTPVQTQTPKPMPTSVPPTATKLPTPTAAPIPPTDTPQPTNTPTVIPTSVPFCTKIRFGEWLVDDVDDLFHEGTTFSSVPTIMARFDCPGISYSQVSFEWYQNGAPHSTYSNVTGRYDQSNLDHWTNGQFLVSLHSKDGLLGSLSPGEYTLVIYVDGNKATSGIITIE